MATARSQAATSSPAAPAPTPAAADDDDGATPRELILEACRRNNTDLLAEVLSSIRPTTSPTPTTSTSTSTSTSTAPAHPAPPTADSQTPTEAAIAALLNGVRDSTGATPLHVAAAAGSLDALDVLLDQPGVETDPRDRLAGETPLHAAVRFVNGLGADADAWAGGAPVVEILLDAGCDPRLRNRAQRRAVELVDVRNESLRDLLRRAEVLIVEGEGVVDEDEDEDEDEDAGGGAETPSDSE